MGYQERILARSKKAQDDTVIVHRMMTFDPTRSLGSSETVLPFIKLDRILPLPGLLSLGEDPKLRKVSDAPIGRDARTLNVRIDVKTDVARRSEQKDIVAQTYHCVAGKYEKQGRQGHFEAVLSTDNVTVDDSFCYVQITCQDPRTGLRLLGLRSLQREGSVIGAGVEIAEKDYDVYLAGKKVFTSSHILMRAYAGETYEVKYFDKKSRKQKVISWVFDGGTIEILREAEAPRAPAKSVEKKNGIRHATVEQLIQAFKNN